MKPRIQSTIQAACLLLPALLVAPVLSTHTPFFGAPAAAFADEATSQVAGVGLPKGAARTDDAKLSEGLGRLLDMWAKERELEPGGKAAEVLIWSGSNYKTGRAGATQATLERALEGDGYKYQSFMRDQVYASPFDEATGLSEFGEPTTSVSFSPFDKQTYFVAVNEKKRRTLVGVWFDQGNAKQLVLALAAVGFESTEEAPLPEVSDPNAVVVKDYNDAMKDAPAPKNPTFPKMTVKAGHIRGMVKDGSGKPLQGARILVESSAVGGFGTSVTATTDAKGVYEIAVPQGACKAVMSGYTVRYNNKHYVLPLHPVDGECENFPSSKGHVENFVLRAYGVADPARAEEDPKYGGFYYGGSVRVMWLVDDIPQGGTVEVTLTPQGNLLDGGKGRTLVFRLPNKHGGDMNLNNIPLGRYILTARLLEDGEAQPLRAKKAKADDEVKDSLQIDFEPKSREQVWTKSGGTERFDVVLKF